MLNDAQPNEKKGDTRELRHKKKKKKGTEWTTTIATTIATTKT